MTSITELQNLHSLVETSSGKFLCFTRVDNKTLHLCASDGYTIWKLVLDPSDLEAYREIADVNMDAYLGKIKNGFDSGDMTVSEAGVKCTVNISHGSQSISFELYEAKAVEKKTELHGILFHLAEQSKEMEKQLQKANSSLDNLKQQKNVPGGSGDLFNLTDAKKTKYQAKINPKQTGMSIINPGSRKRAPTKGIDFN